MSARRTFGFRRRRLPAHQEAAFDTMLPRDRILHPQRQERVGFHRVDQRLEHGPLAIVVIATEQQHVAACLHRPHGSGFDGLLMCDRTHLEVIGHHDPVVAQLGSEQIVHDGTGEGGRVLRIERGYQHVGGHQSRDARRDGRSKRNQLDGVQAVRRMVDHRQFHVRVGAGVAVAGKVLAAGRHAVGLQCPDNHGPQPRHLIRALRQRPVADHRVLKVRVNVEHRRKVEGDADRRQLGRERRREPLGQRLVAATTQRRHGRPFGKRRAEPRDAPTLLVDAHPRGPFAPERVGIVRQLGYLFGRLDVAGEKNDAPQRRTRAPVPAARRARPSPQTRP